MQYYLTNKFLYYQNDLQEVYQNHRYRCWVSPHLLAKLENGKMANFPKAITINQLSDALKFENELFLLADILFEQKELQVPEKSVEDELREILATKTSLNSKNINQVLYFISGLEKLQKIEML